MHHSHERIWIYTHRGRDQARQVFSTINRQPGWVTRAALYAFAAIIMVPIMLLVLFALATAVVVFVLLVAANTVIGTIRGLFSGGSGRSSNVRVIRYDDPRR